MNKTKKNIISTIILIILVGSGLLLSRMPNGPQTQDISQPIRPVIASQPLILEQNNTLSFPGRAHPCQRATLFFRVSGPIISVEVKPGDNVKKDQILMKIDPRDYQRQIDAIESQIISAKANLRAMRSGARIEDINILQQAIVAAQANADLAQIELNRNTELLEKSAISRQLFDQSQARWQIASAELAKLQQELSKAKTGARPEDIDAAVANLLSLEVSLEMARDQLKDTIIAAPFDGIITTQMLEKHEIASAGQPVLEIHDISKIEIAIDVPERHLNIMHNHQYQTSFLALNNQKFDTEFYEWSAKANDIAGTFNMIFRINQKNPPAIFPGMSATLTARPNLTANDIIAIPINALFDTNGSNAKVWVIDTANQTASPREIKLGNKHSDKNIIVNSGLDATEWIVTSGSDFVRPDQKLNIIFNQENN